MRGRCPYPQTTIGRLEMKKMLMGAASVIALSIAAPAFAQSTSTVNQSNTGNGAVVDQTGSLSGGDSLVNQSGASNSANRSDEHTSELQSLMRISYAVFCLKKNPHTSTQQLSPQQPDTKTSIMQSKQTTRNKKQDN